MAEAQPDFLRISHLRKINARVNYRLLRRLNPEPSKLFCSNGAGKQANELGNQGNKQQRSGKLVLNCFVHGLNIEIGEATKRHRSIGIGEGIACQSKQRLEKAHLGLETTTLRRSNH